MDESGSSRDRVLTNRTPREAAWLEYIRLAARGDESAFASFYDETTTLVYSLAIRLLGNVEDAEEVTLDVYNQVWRIAKSFTTERGSVTAWLMTLARTRSLDRLRARASRQRNVEPIPEQFDPPANTSTPEEESVSSQQRRIMAGAMSQLPAEQRRALELAYFQGLSHSELAEVLGEPLGTVKTRIRLGMMKLRELLAVATGTGMEAGA